MRIQPWRSPFAPALLVHPIDWTLRRPPHKRFFHLQLRLPILHRRRESAWRWCRSTGATGLRPRSTTPPSIAPLGGLGLAIYGFNPQPEPPIGFVDPASIYGFNPQPEPPIGFLGAGFLNPLSIYGFNPQPEPPVGFDAAVGGGM